MKIGNVQLDNEVFLSPMAGVTDLPFRTICKEKGCGMLYTEMINAKALCYDDENTKKMLRMDKDEHPVAVQIFGSDPEFMGKAAIIMNQYPKIRKGWDDDSVNAVEIAKIAEECGISALAIHGRTREQFYSGKADWDIIAEIKQAINIPVIGNGDVFEVEDAVNMLEKTKCDAIMIGRGAQGNPWIINRINHYMKTGEILPEPTLEEKITTAIRHMNLAVAEHGDYVAVREMRKHIGWYLKGLKNSAKYRDQINKITDYKEVITMLEEYMQHSLTQIG